ncbi:McbC-like oxidoreductase for polypeptide thioester cyclization (fragment) [Desulfamplus magnetovallimortis]|uniref:McbC-like oxidoreductase for polypeptide thioester cyclization n=1 Tax=Desulfamplus magnetovallimortis TaxID=1246637 RepID=A0A1W1H7R3_9BACT
MSDVTRRKFLSAAASSTALVVLKPSGLFAAQKEFEILPSPSIGGSKSLMSALKNLKSTRSFSNKPLPQQVLSDLLWAAFGVNRPETGDRTAPSPMSSQEIEIYVVTVNGLFLYDARFHQLVQLSTEDIRSFCGTQGFVAHAPLNLIYVADFSKLGNKNNDKKMFYSAADTGFISQNVYLYCVAFGLGTVVRDWIDRPSLAAKINLREDQKIILAQSVGYPK